MSDFTQVRWPLRLLVSFCFDDLLAPFNKHFGAQFEDSLMLKVRFCPNNTGTVSSTCTGYTS